MRPDAVMIHVQIHQSSRWMEGMEFGSGSAGTDWDRADLKDQAESARNGRARCLSHAAGNRDGRATSGVITSSEQTDPFRFWAFLS